MTAIRWCDCAYIAPEVIKAGHRCSRCQAVEEAMKHALALAKLIVYLEAKGVPGVDLAEATLLRDIANRLLVAKAAAGKAVGA